MKSINDLIWDPSASSDCGAVARIGEGCHDDGIMASCGGSGWGRCPVCHTELPKNTCSCCNNYWPICPNGCF